MKPQHEMIADYSLAELTLPIYTPEFTEELVNTASAQESATMCIDPEALVAELRRDQVASTLVRVSGWLIDGETEDIPVTTRPMAYVGPTLACDEIRLSFIDPAGQHGYTARLGDVCVTVSDSRPNV